MIEIFQQIMQFFHFSKQNRRIIKQLTAGVKRNLSKIRYLGMSKSGESTISRIFPPTRLNLPPPLPQPYTFFFSSVPFNRWAIWKLESWNACSSLRSGHETYRLENEKNHLNTSKQRLKVFLKLKKKGKERRRRNLEFQKFEIKRIKM